MPEDKYFITMLGTGNALATRCYNTCFTLHSSSGAVLIMALQFHYSLHVWSHQKVLRLLDDICRQVLPWPLHGCGRHGGCNHLINHRLHTQTS